MSRHTKHFTPKFEQILCRCGCKTYFSAVVVTKPPRFMNETHRKRWTRQNAKEKIAQKKDPIARAEQPVSLGQGSGDVPQTDAQRQSDDPKSSLEYRVVDGLANVAEGLFRLSAKVLR